jgi:hypothetical protein
MKPRLLGTLALVIVAAAALVAQGAGGAPQGQRAGAPQGQRAAAPPKPKRVVIVTGEDSFAGHVWKDTSAELKNILDSGKDFAEVVIQADPNYIANDEFLTYDVAVFDFRNANPLAQEEKAEANLQKFVTIHWANGAFPYWPEFVNIVGLAQQSQHDPRGPFTVKLPIANHPITKGMQDYEADDELYWDTKEGNKTFTAVATATSKVHYRDFPMAIEFLYKSARIFNTPMGHDVKALKVPGTAELIRRGTLWAANLPIK